MGMMVIKFAIRHIQTARKIFTASSTKFASNFPKGAITNALSFCLRAVSSYHREDTRFIAIPIACFLLSLLNIFLEQSLLQKLAEIVKFTSGIKHSNLLFQKFYICAPNNFRI